MTASSSTADNQGDPEVLRVVARKKSRRWRWIVLLLVLVAGSVSAFFVWKRQTTTKQATQYQTQKVEKGDLRVSVTATGTLKARSTVEVGAEITGRVLQVHVNFNDKVTAGQVLAEIDTETYRARVEEAAAQLTAASASLQTAKATANEAKQKVERGQSTVAQGVLAQQDFETLQANYERAKAQVVSAGAQVTLAQASLKVAKTNLSKAVIRSPIDGIVLNRNVEPGQTVTSGLQTPVLFVLAADLGELQLNVQVDEADVGNVREGQEATFTVDAYSRKSFTSKVLAVKNMPTSGTTVVTYEAWLSVDNEKRLLRPGMTATATIVVNERKDVLLVPNAALRFNPNRRTSGSTQKGVSVDQFLPTARRPTTQMKRAPGGFGGPREPSLWLPTGGDPKRIKVETGPSDGVRTEVSSPDVSEGTEVILTAIEAPRE